MILAIVKKWYGFVLHVGLGSFYILGTLIEYGAVNGTYLVFTLTLIVLPILKLVYPHKSRHYSLFLSIIDGLFVVTGIILTFAIIEQFYIGFGMVFLFGISYWLESQALKNSKESAK